MLMSVFIAHMQIQVLILPLLCHKDDKAECKVQGNVKFLPPYFVIFSESLVFCYISSAIYFVTSLGAFLCLSPTQTSSTHLLPPLPFASWPSTSFISACASVYLPFRGLIYFPISLSYMLEASCMTVNEGAAWVNTQNDTDWQEQIYECVQTHANRWTWIMSE